METVMETVRRNALERVIVAVCSTVLWATTAVIFVILTANTVLRYTGGTGLQWANEVRQATVASRKKRGT